MTDDDTVEGPAGTLGAVIASHRWATCGAMALTGDRDGPPLAPDTDAGLVLDEALGPFGLDARVLTERASILGLRRNGTTSCGGATRLLRGSDGWLAAALPRDDDVVALDAAVGVRASGAEEAWPRLAAVVARRACAEVAASLGELGVACAPVGEGGGPFTTTRTAAGSGRSGAPTRAPLVLDLSTLWAGPLCTSLLARVGADVVKVEDPARPDGGRAGAPAFFDLLNHGKESVALSFADPDARLRLAALVDAADIVVTSARARAVTQVGLDPDRFLAAGQHKVWVAITAHGWRSPRVGFGDDAACAAGLVAWHPVDGEPRFVADAVADPLCGSFAAAEALRCWHDGGRWFVDASLSGAAARVVGEQRPASAASRDAATQEWHLDAVTVALPAARAASGPAAALGTHTDAVLARLVR